MTRVLWLSFITPTSTTLTQLAPQHTPDMTKHQLIPFLVPLMLFCAWAGGDFVVDYSIVVLAYDVVAEFLRWEPSKGCGDKKRDVRQNHPI
jgi:hypothetical protein